MKKIKSLWKNNRVLFALFIILIICFIAIVTVALSYFVGSEKDPHGNRLDNKVEISKDFANNLEKFFKDDELVKDAKVRTSIRTIYVRVEFDSKISLVEAEGKATASLDIIDKKLLEYYDFNYILTKEASESSDAFSIMGARNVNGTGFIWNNNNITDEQTKE